MRNHPVKPRFLCLSELWTDRFDVWVYCNAEPTKCRRSAKLDLLAMILKHGDLDGRQLRRRLKCDVCGSKKISTSMSATGAGGQQPRELPVEVRKKLLADRVAVVTTTFNGIDAYNRDGKPVRF